MLEQIIKDINGKIQQLDIFERLFGLCEFVEKDGAVYPYEYQANGQFKPTTNFDFQRGLVYHRETTPFNERTSDKFDNQRNIITRTYFIRTVAIFPRNIIKTDNQYSVDNVRSLLSYSISDPVTSPMAKNLGAYGVELNVSTGSMNRIEILETEFNGMPKGIDERFGAVAIDYDVEVTIDKKCLLTSTTNCE